MAQEEAWNTYCAKVVGVVAVLTQDTSCASKFAHPNKILPQDPRSLWLGCLSTVGINPETPKDNRPSPPLFKLGTEAAHGEVADKAATAGPRAFGSGLGPAVGLEDSGFVVCRSFRVSRVSGFTRSKDFGVSGVSGFQALLRCRTEVQRASVEFSLGV